MGKLPDRPEVIRRLIAKALHNLGFDNSGKVTLVKLSVGRDIMKLHMLSVALVLTVAACAKPPASIGPSFVSDVGYRNMSCNQLTSELARVNTQLPPLVQQQSNAATGDAVGVFLVGIPVSSLGGGDVESQISRLRGERQTIESLIISKSC